MQISHALYNLLSNDDYLVEGKLFLAQMQMGVQSETYNIIIRFKFQISKSL